MLHQVDACVQHVTLLERGSKGSMKPVFEVKLAPPLDDMREQIAEERGVFVKERSEVKSVLGGDELVESNLVRGQLRPVAKSQTVFWIRPSLADPLENHPAECTEHAHCRPVAV
jgi:hypothetical protein